MKVFQALKQLLSVLCEQKTLIIELDDALQWIDAESVALLRHLVVDTPAKTMLVLATRPTPLDPFADLLADAKDVTRLVLNPLSFEESKQLISLLLLDTAEHALSPGQIAERSGGHPLFIHELVVHGSSHHEPTATLEGAIGARVESLDDDSRRSCSASLR